MLRPGGKKQVVDLEFASYRTRLLLPENVDVLRAREPEVLDDVPAEVRRALAEPTGCPPLGEVVAKALATAAELSVVVVISDHSRPVPYKGESGILWPLVEQLLETGVPSEWITLLVATGTHRVLGESEIWSMVDERVRDVGVRAVCHDAADSAGLLPLSAVAGQACVSVNRIYAEAGLRILTGLVEPHFMAGASGGRKSICPGLLDVRSVRDFHGPAVVASEGIGDLCMVGNPCHQHSLRIASLVPADFILNVTTRADGRVAGVFAGDMEAAHAAAVEHLRSFSEVALEHDYDVVVTHSAHVGINHYQASKAIGSGAAVLSDGGYLVMLADSTDADPVGSASYRWLLGVLARDGATAFQKLIMSEEWEFTQDQWAVQSLARLQERVPREHLLYFSPQTRVGDYAILPCRDPASVLPDVFSPTHRECPQPPGETAARFARAALEVAMQQWRLEHGREARVACLADGPHCVPRVRGVRAEK